MEAAEEEGRATGRLKPGHRTVAGVVTQDVYDAIAALRAERGLGTMSRAVGDALREWASVRSQARLKPVGEGGETSGRSATNGGLKPAEPQDVALSSWQEVRGRVTGIADDRRRVDLDLEDGIGVVRIHVPAPLHAPALRVGARVAILRTDEPGREYVVRQLD